MTMIQKIENEYAIATAMSLPSQLRIFAPPGAVGPFGLPCPSSGALAYQGPGVTGRLGGTGNKVMKDPLYGILFHRFYLYRQLPFCLRCHLG